jgi:hypothetical protein
LQNARAWPARNRIAASAVEKWQAGSGRQTKGTKMERDQEKPWAGEFPLDDPNDIDDEAVRIIVENLRRGKTDPDVDAKLARMRGESKS